MNDFIFYQQLIDSLWDSSYKCTLLQDSNKKKCISLVMHQEIAVFFEDNIIKFASVRLHRYNVLLP